MLIIVIYLSLMDVNNQFLKIYHNIYNNNYDYLGGTYYKADPYQFYNGDFDIIIENAADLDTDEADESD